MWPWLKHQGLVLCIGVQYWIRKVRWHVLSAFTMSLSKCLNRQSYSLGFPLGFLRQKVGFLSMFSLRSLHFLLCPLMFPIHSTGLFVYWIHWPVSSLSRSAAPPWSHLESFWGHPDSLQATPLCLTCGLNSDMIHLVRHVKKPRPNDIFEVPNMMRSHQSWLAN